DMVVMQVRTHHQINFLGSRAGGCEALKIRNIEHVPEWPAWLDLVVAAARIDQNFLAADLQQPAMHGEPDLSGFRLVMMRREPRFVLRHMRIGEFGKDVPERIAGKIGFLDTYDRCIADTEHWHSPDYFFGRYSLVKVAGKSTSAGPFGWR